MLSSRLARLKHLEEADLAQEGEVVILRVQYAANGDEPPVWGPTYTYRLGADQRLWEDVSDET